jgi:hypothetical protein
MSSLFANGLDLPRKKLRIFFPFMHPEVQRSMAFALNYLGHTLLVTGESFSPKNPGITLSYASNYPKNSYLYPYVTKENLPWLNLPPNVEIIENDELFINPPDVVFIGYTPIEREVLSQIWPKLKEIGKTKLAYFTGADVAPYLLYEVAYLKNLLVTDNSFHIWAKKVNPNCHVLQWIPWIDFDQYQYQGPSDQMTIGIYIVDLKNRIPMDYNLSMELINAYHSAARTKIHFIFHDSTPQAQVPKAMHQTIATLHIKHIEGFGYSIIQSLAMGRPVFLFREYSNGRRYLEWCIEGKTCFYVSSEKEFFKKLNKLVQDRSYRHSIQSLCAKTIRKIINNEENALKLQSFLENLQ